MSFMKTVVIYLGGDGPLSFPGERTSSHVVIAADSGLELAHAHGIAADVVVGDMDSVDPELLQQYVDSGTKMMKFPQDKNETDFELALDVARQFNAEKLLVVGGGGQRLDQLLANIAILSGYRTNGWLTDMVTATEHVAVCRSNQPRTFTCSVGDIISLIPIEGDAIGVTTSGLKWELEDSTLDVHAARGLSNVCVNHDVRIEINSGSLAFITRTKR